TLAASLVLAVPAAAGADPPVRNAIADTRPAGADGAATVRALVAASSSPAWIGWLVPMNGAHSMCCFDEVAHAGGSRRSGCALEGRASFDVGDHAGGSG